MRAWTVAAVMVTAATFLGMASAAGEDDQTPESTAAADPAAQPAGPDDVATATAATAEFKVPPGFRKKQRGKHTVYCRKETVMGTRFEQEKCYDEQGLREYELALREDREKVDQLRRICSSARTCGGT